MRILHTSDWHLGQHFIGKTRYREHQKFIDWIIGKVDKYQIDIVIISGDLFDTGTPPSYARELLNHFIVALKQHECQLVALAGNHDSVATLNESKMLLSQLNTYVIPQVTSDIESQVLLLNERTGEPGAIICAIPFIRPRDIIKSQSEQSSREKSNQLGNAISDHYQVLYQHARERQKEIEERVGRKLPIIATGHLTAMGVKSSESVRDIYIGSLEAFPASQFPPADYIALGHIHRPQVVAQSDHIRYSGSPIPLSFDELKWDKQVLMIEFDSECVAQVTPLKIPQFQPMACIRGDLSHIEQSLHMLDDSGELPIWLSVEIETEDYLTDLQQRIEVLTDDLNVEVLLLRRVRSLRQQQISRESRETLDELNPYEVFERRLALEQFESEEQQQKLGAIRSCFSEVIEELVEEHGITIQSPVNQIDTQVCPSVEQKMDKPLQDQLFDSEAELRGDDTKSGNFSKQRPVSSAAGTVEVDQSDLFSELEGGQ